MTENTTTTVADTTSSRGAQWAGAGSLIAIAAQSLLGGGILGNLGGGILGGNAAAQAGNTLAALELAKKDSEIALLKSEVSTNEKLSTVYAELRKMDKEQDALIAALGSRVSAIETAAPLREQIVLGKIGEVATLSTTGLANLGSQLTCLANQVAGITKTIVPASAVCPQPMPLHNSWTAPTAAAA